jgi:hypothetical protein
MSVLCPACHGTGERNQSGFLDCTHPGCTAAHDRAEFNKFMQALGPMTQADRDWAAYLYGRTAQASDSFDALLAQLEKINKGNA